MADISTESYKGVRDFYPEDWQRMQKIFAIIRSSVERYGYQEYNASPLESTELYLSKTSDEIVNEQTYTFIDRGDRSVTLRPEMTPTVSRMVAAKMKALSYPIRWYSIPNVFRYEKPQRGRLREHYQLNVDLFGMEGIEADTEIVQLASFILTSFGAKESDFVIKLNSRSLMNALFSDLGLTPDKQKSVIRLIDKIKKISKEDVQTELNSICDTSKQQEAIKQFIAGNIISTNEAVQNAKQELDSFIENLAKIGITNAEIDLTLARGFDYYTGIVFEVFDTDPKNNRSLFGGGRYDGLTTLFGEKALPAVGFGMGDVTLQDFLEARSITPKTEPAADIYICRAGISFEQASIVADDLRRTGIRVLVDLSTKKIGDQISKASKENIPYVLVIGENELQNKAFELKNLADGSVTTGSITEIVEQFNDRTV
ncbi:MAG TPA: histidine--tRNA ligase [Candidatus Paceibacterota bacterium]|nr:histidine--tRNA ligase [Candidatus Paceibacterota bacterium]